ncbi:uncharacterized protein LOC118506958 [Anopheles stephensi]|uniref:uncharacterized protein LOC118506958 n=1 Tax=Anopheles stephensi TaxID=30069 RepID=UPI001658C396|nr:uncharacterized protein LOC118506958 [Anopheles stephensi]
MHTRSFCESFNQLISRTTGEPSAVTALRHDVFFDTPSFNVAASRVPRPSKKLCARIGNITTAERRTKLPPGLHGYFPACRGDSTTTRSHSDDGKVGQLQPKNI